MNSFTLTAVGNLARNPEAVAKGDITYTRFLLVGNDYAGKDDEGAPREIVTSLWFVAFGGLAESLARSARKGDQLIIEARVRASNRTDKQGEKQYDHDFVVQGFRFGAPGKIKREERDARRDDGALRAEDRSNGRAHGGVATVSDGDSGAANGSTVSAAAAARGPRGVSGTNSPVGANGANSSNSANADNSGNGGGAAPGGEANGANGVTGNADANGSAAAASEKPAASSRGGRRAASAPP